MIVWFVNDIYILINRDVYGFVKVKLSMVCVNIYILSVFCEMKLLVLGKWFFKLLKL